MSKAEANFKWYRLDDEGRLKSPCCERVQYYGDDSETKYLENYDGFDTEIEAVNALAEFFGDETYESSSYILIKSYIITNSRW